MGISYNQQPTSICQPQPPCTRHTPKSAPAPIQGVTGAALTNPTGRTHGAKSLRRGSKCCLGQHDTGSPAGWRVGNAHKGPADRDGGGVDMEGSQGKRNRLSLWPVSWRTQVQGWPGSRMGCGECGNVFQCVPAWHRQNGTPQVYPAVQG